MADTKRDEVQYRLGFAAALERLQSLDDAFESVLSKEGRSVTETDKSLTVGSPNQVVIVENCEDLSSYLVRDLSINELERLQGLPTDWTSPSPISHRRQQLANAVPTAIAEWIGSRVLQYDNEIPS